MTDFRAVLIRKDGGAHLLCAAGGSDHLKSQFCQERSYLKQIGAVEIIPRSELSGDMKPLAKGRCAGAFDSAGSKTLANVLAATKYAGAVAACRLAQGMDLPTGVAPFILRGVSLLGAESVCAPRERRLRVWSRLGARSRTQQTAAITQMIALGDVFEAAEEIFAGKVRGRLVIDMSR